MALRTIKVGVLGTGEVGQKLGSGFVSIGCEVKMGSRDPKNDKARAWAAENGAKASVGTFEEAASFGEMVVLATLWSGTENAIRLAHPVNFATKVVMDVTNPLVFADGKPPALALGHTDSGGEQVQRWLKDAKVVKAFNTVGNAHMVKPQFPGGPPDMFICGNDEGAKKAVSDVCEAWSWGVIDLGGIEGSRLLEPMCLVWITYGIRNGTWNHAFKLLRK